MSQCATCGANIDPARAPVARIRHARIVTFCSVACADAPAPQPAAPIAPARKLAPIRRLTTSAPALAPASLETTSSRRRPKLALAAAVVVVAGLVTLVAFGFDRPARETVTASATPAIEVTALRDAGVTAATDAVDAQPVLDPETLEAAATAVLTELLDDGSPRIRHLAAMALSRTGDRQAIKALARTMAKDPSPLLRINAAYGLARAHDPRGTRALIAALDDDGRDVRLDAARALTLVGSKAGKKTLIYMMRLSRHRIGTAAILARLGDPQGLAILHDELRGKSDEVAMRAAVALGRAGDDSVHERLVAILESGKFQIGAAEALAALGDKVAADVLARQLESPSLRVDAAEALVSLGAEVDLTPLAVSLKASDPASRVTAAEAVLVLVAGKGESKAG